MEFLRIKDISEANFDGIVAKAGGSRIDSEGSADYRLGEAVVELKLVQEEGFEAPARQAKIARLFRQQQPGSSVVVIDPKTLNPEQSREYYRIVERPIKRPIYNADKQLEATANRLDPQLTRVLVLLNLGYTALTPDEFQSVAVKCVHNDTTKIDFLICGGIYFHSDKFDNYLFERFVPLPINLNRTFPGYDRLLQSWNEFVEALMTSLIREPTPPNQGRLPVIDLAFELDGIRYIKPSPRVPSNFFPTGEAPRENTSHLSKCPPVGVAFPGLTKTEWDRFKAALPLATTLKESYARYVDFQNEQDPKYPDRLKPFVPMPITFEAFAKDVGHSLHQCTFTDVCKFAARQFDAKLRDLLDSVKEVTNDSILPVELFM